MTLKPIPGKQLKKTSKSMNVNRDHIRNIMNLIHRDG